MNNQKIGEVCGILSGYAFDSKLFSNDRNDMPLIRIRDVMRGYTNTYTKEIYDSKYIIKNGDLLIGMDGEFNIAPWQGGDALLNQRVCKIWASSSELFNSYLLYFLPKALKDIERETSFVTVKHLSVYKIREINIPLPPLETQKQIAKTLDTAAELLAMRKQQLAELDNLITSTFYDMFGDPVTNEMGWEVKKLGEVCNKITDGKHGDCKDEAGSGYFFISAKNIDNGTIKYENARQITQFDFEETNKRTKLSPGDLLVVNTGATIGKTAIATDDEKTYKTTFQKSVGIIQVNPSELSNLFLNYYINIDRENIYNAASGSAQKNWLLSQMRNYLIFLPPINLQEKFAYVATRIEEQKALVKKAIDETQYLFDSLMAQYFD
ncbi:restriction endonuclease subunit S [Brevibacillus nitrificans]|uniref:restriction endonuclease subunit S n=1 Tax=Brevibacillus nitrificans TaxID=651560 RepID=UPI0026361F3C|nr:restriction endonuclease subunit S [Brevibacillus nitrificans]